MLTILENILQQKPKRKHCDLRNMCNFIIIYTVHKKVNQRKIIDVTDFVEFIFE